MRILIVAPFVNLDSRMADSTHVHELATELANKVEFVYIIAQKNSGKSQNDVLKNNIKVINVHVCDDHTLNRILCLFYAALSAMHVLLFQNIDIVYERHLIIPVGLCTGKLCSKKVITESNGCGIDELKLTGAIKNIYKYTEKKIMRSTDSIIAVTDGIKRNLMKHYSIDNKKIVVIENGANIELFKPMEVSKNKLVLDSGTKYVCFVGSLAPWQGIDTLIKAAPSVLNEIPNARFLIVGDGMMKDTWIQLTEQLDVADMFMFIGSIPYEQVPLYINAGDLCVVPKKPLKSGYSPLKMYEYMACGKAVIASKVNGFEQLENVKAGLLVEPENSTELSTAIIRLLLDDTLRIQMAKNGREYVIKHHTWNHVAGRILKRIYEL